MSPVYLTTPIYYVNDRPHIGHCYTTLVADVAARWYRLMGREVFFLTGTDEHADKVVTTGAAAGMSPQAWADRNAAEFVKAFALLGVSNDDFLRTTQARHTGKVVEYVAALKASGDVYLGDYAGWYDESQDEYLTETVAKESPHGPYTSPVTGRALVRRTEKNYFFRLSKYAGALRELLERDGEFVRPEARRNEVLGRLREGLNDVPISRAITDDPASAWGIRMPGDPGHRIYVWIDALFNYLSAVDAPGRTHLWPASAHVMAKDILWFHAVIWPALLMALGRALPRRIYAHAYWVRDGKKMSKSLGNFVDIDTLGAYVDRYGVDAVRYYLVSQGPGGSGDADFSHAKFVEVFNADLANALGNATSRVATMIGKYFEGRCPDPGPAESPRHRGLAGHDWPAIIAARVREAVARADALDVPGALAQGVGLVRQVDGYINATEPFKLAKRVAAEPGARDDLGAILYHCAEALRVASLLMAPATPNACASLAEAWGFAAPFAGAAGGPGSGPTLTERAAWLGAESLTPGQVIRKGDNLFQRADPAEPPPGA